MAKKRDRIVNTQPFITDDASVASSRKRSKITSRLNHAIGYICLLQDVSVVDVATTLTRVLIEAGISSKIMKVALAQQKEIADEENAESNPSGAVFAAAAAKTAEEEQRILAEDETDDIDAFDGKFEDDSYHQEEINEDDEKLFESFFVKDAPRQRTLADIIIKKIKDNDANLAEEERPDPELDPKVTKLYKGVAKIMSEYTIGKMPKAFVLITKMERWEDVLYLTEPEKWSPNAMYQATRIFAHHLKNSQIQRFYSYVLLPRVREDIRKNKRLHFALYQALKKSLYKPSAFNKGILFPLCKSGTCSLREAVIIGSILEKCSIPMLHSCVALLNLAEMEYCGTTSYFIKTLLEKKYCMPYRVLDALVAHFMRFVDEIRVMPVIWHQSLLTFVQRYKYELLKEDKEHFQTLLKRQRHHLVTPEILRELQGEILKAVALGEDVTGGCKGIQVASALSNAVTRLARDTGLSGEHRVFRIRKPKPGLSNSGRKNLVDKKKKLSSLQAINENVLVEMPIMKSLYLSSCGGDGEQVRSCYIFLKGGLKSMSATVNPLSGHRGYSFAKDPSSPSCFPSSRDLYTTPERPLLSSRARHIL
ncbi:hypothetical protein Bca101_055535 [Brassica carinata]